MRHVDPFLPLFEEIAATYGNPDEPIKILGIGSYVGSSDMAFLKGITRRPGGGKLVAVDHRNYEEHNRKQMRLLGLDDSKYQYVQGDSTKESTVEKVKDMYDVMFIDGGHDLETVTSDHLKYVVPMLRPGGWVAYHDINIENYGVPKFWSGINPVDWAEKYDDIRSPGACGILVKKA